MPLSVDKTSEKLMGVPEHERQAKICAEVSEALRPGTNSPRMSSSPRRAVIAPVGSFRMASAMGIPYYSDEPRMLRMAGLTQRRCGETDELYDEEILASDGLLDRVIDLSGR